MSRASRTRAAARSSREPASASAPRRARADWLQVPTLYPSNLPRDLGALALVVLGLLVLYAASTSSTVLLEDDGLFLMSAATLGVSHPPGYPVHTLLGWLVSHLPGGTQAFRVHLMSGVFAAVACGVLGWIVRRRTGSLALAVLAALSFGVSEHVWSQSVLAEVYTLNVLFVFVVMALALEASVRLTTARLVVVAALYGLSLANHWPLMVLATPAIVFVLACRWRDVLPRLPWLAVVAVVAASVPYAWMVWRSRQDPLISFYGPLESWREIYFYVSRRGYATADASATAGIADKFGFAAYVLRESLVALTPVGAGLAIAGAVRRWRDRDRLAVVGEGLAFAASGVVLAFLLGFDFDFLRVAVFRPYPLVAYGLLALWMASGARWLLDLAGERRAVALVSLAALFLMPAALAAMNWRVNDRSRDVFADRYARTVLDLVEPEAALLLYADTDTAPIGYLHVVEGVRPDVTLYNLQGLVFNNRLLPALARPSVRQERLKQFLSSATRPVYHMTEKILPPGLAEEHYGFVRRVLPGQAPGRPKAVHRPRAEALFRELRAMSEPRDRWVRMTRNQLLHRYGTFLGLAQVDTDPALREALTSTIAQAEGNYYSLSGMVESLVEHGTTREAWERAASYLERGERLKDDSLDAERLGREFYLRAFVAFRLGDVDGATRLFQRSVEVHPSPENGSHLALQQLAQIRAGRAGGRD